MILMRWDWRGGSFRQVTGRGGVSGTGQVQSDDKHVRVLVHYFRTYWKGCVLH